MRTKTTVGWYGVATLTTALAASVAAQEWTTHGGDLGEGRFSPLTQITKANVGSLERAWEFEAGASNLQLTPLVVGGQMYITAGSNIFAVEPDTGKQIWRFEAPGAVSRRGVAYWPGDAKTPARLYSGAGDRLIALDARTGRLVPEFGTHGLVDLNAGIKGDVEGRTGLVSPPIVYKDLLITGGNNGEQAPSFGLYGDIRAWDARTGALKWTFHTVPRPGEPGVETWEGDSWKNRSGTNMWSFFTIDAERGIVYVPLGSPTSDYYGGDRKGKNLYGNSIVALDAATGKLKWHQQLVHHDLWDFDLPAAPTLIDVRRNGQTIPAVAVLTKVTLLFIFDRVTGEPLFGMEERPVPKSTVPGEQAWPTQPFPLKPPPLGRIDFDPAKDFYALTPEHAAYCKDLWAKHQMYTEGVYTPPSMDRTMVTFPSTLGGGNWNGLAYDKARGLVFTNVMNIGQVARMQFGKDRRSGQEAYLRTSPWGGPVGRFWNPENKIPCSAPPFGELVAVNVNTGDVAWKVPIGRVDELHAKGFTTTGALNIGQVARMQFGKDRRSGQEAYLRTSPWGGPVGRFWNPENKIPCSAPPFGELVAVNVNTGDIAWKVPIGRVDELHAKGFTTTGALNIGGAIATASGLLFIGATNDAHFRAFDSESGTLLWETRLEASAHSIPSTYLGKDGRQYLVVPAGGGSFLGSPNGTKIVAFALPEAH